MSAFVAAAAPRLTPAAEVLRFVEGMSTRGGRLGLATPGLLRSVFGAPRGGGGNETCLLYSYDGNGLLSLMWCCTQLGRVGPAVGITAEKRRQCGRVAEVWRLACFGCGHIRNLQGPRERSRAVQFPSWQEIIEGARYLLSRAPEDGALETPSLDCAKVLSRMWVRWGRQVAALSEALTLLELLPGLPPERTVDIVEPLAIAGQEVGVSLRERESMLVAAKQRVAARPALVPTSNEEWGKIGAELLRRKKVVEIDLSDEPEEDWFRILFWVLDVVKSGVAAPLASLIVRLFVNAIPSSSLQRRILVDEKKIAKGDEWLYVCLENEMIFLGDGEKVPGADEWLYVCLGENEMIFWRVVTFLGVFACSLSPSDGESG